MPDKTPVKDFIESAMNLVVPDGLEYKHECLHDLCGKPVEEIEPADLYWCPDCHTFVRPEHTKAETKNG